MKPEDSDVVLCDHCLRPIGPDRPGFERPAVDMCFGCVPDWCDWAVETIDDQRKTIDGLATALKAGGAGKERP